MTLEEHQRRGEAADALFREIVRPATGKDRPADPDTALAQLRHRPSAARRRGPRRAIPGVPSWFMRITCDRCGQQRMFSETHAAGQRHMLIRDIIARMRHDGCGGRAGKVELLTDIEGASSRPVRRTVLIGG
jgi:hypothetical protein